MNNIRRYIVASFLFSSCAVAQEQTFSIPSYNDIEGPFIGCVCYNNGLSGALAHGIVIGITGPGYTVAFRCEIFNDYCGRKAIDPNARFMWDGSKVKISEEKK